MTDKITFTLDGETVEAEDGHDHLGSGQRARPGDPASVPQTCARLSP